jgi:hypothetical protein
MLIYEPPPDVSLEQLADELTSAFVLIQAAIRDGDAVVVSLEERHIQGLGDPVQAALAHGLLGLARAVAVEGRQPGWRIAVLSSTPDVQAAERQRWIEQLSEPGAAIGVLVRLGGEHLGRVPA